MDEVNNSPVADEVVETPVDETPESDPILEALETDDDTTPSDADETPEQEESEPESPAEAEQSEEQEQEAQPELDPKEQARIAYEERQRARKERDEQIRTIGEEHIKNGEDEYDQRLRAMEVERYQERITANEDRLIGDYERVKANPDLQIFNPESEEFNREAYLDAIEDFDAGRVVRDELGNISGLKGSLFDYLTKKADLMRGAQKSGAIQQVRATKQMRSNADIKPAVTPKESPKDPILEVLLSD